MIVVEQQTWVTLLGFAGFGLALMGYLTSMRRELKTEIRDSRADTVDSRAEARADNVRLETQIANTHADLKIDIGRLDGRLVALESRMYDIALRLPAPLSPAKPTAS